MSNPFAPDESPVLIFNEELLLQGALLSNIVYGVELTLFVMCFTVLSQQLDRFNCKRQLCLLTFITVIFILGTLFMGAQAKFTQLAFIEERNYPGGPSAFENTMFSLPVDQIANVSLIVGNWLMDALLLWRFIVIYREFGHVLMWALAALPCLMLLASLALGITYMVQVFPSPVVYASTVLSYYVVSLALNILVTILIVGRLLVHRWRTMKVLGRHHVSSYTNAAAILVESAFLYSVFAILFLVPFGLSNQLSNVFIQTVSQVQTVSSLLIVFRVATGKAWTEDTSVQIMANPTGRAGQAENATSILFANNLSNAENSAVFKDENSIVLSRILPEE